MELPNDIWYTIVKQSIKSNSEFITEMDIYELCELERVIKEKKDKIYNTIKSKLNKYDIITYGDYHLLITNLNLKNNGEIKCLYLSNYSGIDCKTIVGNYESANGFNFKIYLNQFDKMKIQVISTLEDRNKENIEIANSLKIGDVFCYSKYCVDYLVRLNHDCILLKNTIDYSIILSNPLQNHFSILCNDNIHYTIQKGLVLEKIGYENNKEIYCKIKKKDYYYKLRDDIVMCNKKNVNDLINLQRKLNIRKTFA